MKFKSDIEIARSARPKNIAEIAEKASIPAKYLEICGRDKAKINLSFLSEPAKRGKLILVTAITPTPAGEGKTTTTVGLADSLSKIGAKAAAALREPSLGPVFGLKGGAAGGGMAQVMPMEDINLHFTGDIHAVGAANNLLAAMLDAHIYHGNLLNIDPRQISWRRCLDINDRQLRNIVSGLGGKTDGVPREDGFDITVASEVMAILCLSKDIGELKKRLSDIIPARTYSGEPVRAGDLKAHGAMAALLKDALKPNLAQTLEHTPVLIHGGPFANIAHGCNSLAATETALRIADYAVTEAGFGADLGAEKFFDIKCRTSGLKPSCAVVVATARALKYHGGVKKTELNLENLDALDRGFCNLERHVSNIREVFKLPCIVAINVFPSDTEAEIEALLAKCESTGIRAALSNVWKEGSSGGIELAKAVVELCETESSLEFAYDLNSSISEKLDNIAVKIYGGCGAKFTPAAKKQMESLSGYGFDKLPICVAKTQYSFSDNPSLYGVPKDFFINVRELRVSAGAGFIVALAGNIMTMPGLSANPAAENIDIDDSGLISGLF